MDPYGTPGRTSQQVKVEHIKQFVVSAILRNLLKFSK